MKFLKFLNEKRSKEIDKKEAEELLLNRCSDALNAYNKGKKLFRGYYYDNGEYSIIDPKKSKSRKSAYANGNYYTLLIDNLPSWKKYPKRSQSIIMSSGYNKATQYTYSPDAVYIVFPYDNANIAIAPSDDIFNSFKMYNEYSMIMGTGNVFNSFLNDLLFVVSKGRSDDNWNTLKKRFALFDHDAKTYIETFTQSQYRSNKKDIKSLFNDNYKGNILKMFDKLMNPSTNHFRLTKDITKIPSDRECWTDSKCILIQQAMMRELFTDKDDSIIDKILDIDETDDTIDFIDNVRCEEILYMYDDIYNAAGDILQKYINKKKKLIDTQPVWLLNRNNKIETNNGKYKYMAIGGSEGCVATVRSCFRKQNTVDVEIIGQGPLPYSIFGNRWEFDNKQEYKNLEDFSDKESLDDDLEDLTNLKLL